MNRDTTHPAAAAQPGASTAALPDLATLPLLQRPVSVLVATRDATHQPHVVRALGLQGPPRSERIAVLIDGAAAEDTLADVRANRQVAVVFCEPSTHRTVQIKGRDARLEPAGPQDAATARSYIGRMTGEIGLLGFAPQMVEALFSHDPAALQVLSFTPCEAYEQTPGAHAGEPLPPQP
ncbi:MAG: pyridoxamine 5'-phosphate oxidase family protein [Aquabacterium sp.]|nr:pyridoxamine 5'-phosphate oxidase family protein [Aquabacterium sp.]